MRFTLTFFVLAFWLAACRRAETPKAPAPAAAPAVMKPGPGVDFVTLTWHDRKWQAAPPSGVRYATQSGPLLVQRGTIHPAFRESSPNRNIRNGVGVRPDGRVVFAISAEPVTFHEMATLFRDALDCPDALYLDGAISAMHAPSAGITSAAEGLGPVLGVWTAG